MRKTVFLIAALLLAGCGEDEPTAAEMQRKKVAALMTKAQVAAQDQLKDPDSVKWEDLEYSVGDDGVAVICGKLNSKNAFGAYAGYQRFLSAGNAQTTFIEEQVKDFDVAWNRFCK